MIKRKNDKAIIDDFIHCLGSIFADKKKEALYRMIKRKNEKAIIDDYPLSWEHFADQKNLIVLVKETKRKSPKHIYVSNIPLLIC
jgi:hypothetical protein